jgi:hypothetical protein
LHFDAGVVPSWQTEKQNRLLLEAKAEHVRTRAWLAV